MDDQRQKEQQQEEKQNTNLQEKNTNVVPDDFKPAMHPGQDAAAKTERKGAGQQQDSAGNPVINS